MPSASAIEYDREPGRAACGDPAAAFAHPKASPAKTAGQKDHPRGVERIGGGDDDDNDDDDVGEKTATIATTAARENEEENEAKGESGDCHRRQSATGTTDGHNAHFADVVPRRLLGREEEEEGRGRGSEGGGRSRQSVTGATDDGRNSCGAVVVPSRRLGRPPSCIWGRSEGGGRLYYAVRAGSCDAAVGPPPSSVSDDDNDGDDVDDEDEDDAMDDALIDDVVDGDIIDGRPSKKRKGNDERCPGARVDDDGGAPPLPKPAPSVRIRSAIFLFWEDARRFVDDGGAEYAAFDSFEEAEEYLMEGERAIATRVANALEMDKAIKSWSADNSATTTAGQMPSIPDHADVGQSFGSSISGKPDARESAYSDENSAQKKMSRNADPRCQEDRWDSMYAQLVLYKELNGGSIDIPEMTDDENNDPVKKQLGSLRYWCQVQSQCQRRFAKGYSDAGNLTLEQINKLSEVGFQLAPSYETMYDRLAAHKAREGTLEVDKDEDEELFIWAREQRMFLARHFEGKPVALSGDRILNLLSLGYTQRPSLKGSAYGIVDAAAEDRKWNAMLDSLRSYYEKHGNFIFRRKLSKHEVQVKNWVAEQRKEYRNVQQGKQSNLTAQRMQHLNEIGLDLTPRPCRVTWEQRLESLREFAAEHGHFRAKRGHPLFTFVRNARHEYTKREAGRPSLLTDERVKDLEEMGFTFKAGKTPHIIASVRKSWDERFEELLAYKEMHGHTIVPVRQGPLGVWVKHQRFEYRRMKAGKSTSMTAEKALKLTEIGFHFDAARFMGPNAKAKKKIIELSVS